MLLPSAPSILVVGGGLTGAACGRALCRLLPSGSSVVVWEALDVLGGRFHTERIADGGACDTGAQYVTVTDDGAVAEAHAPLFAELTSAGVLNPLCGRIEGGRAADGGGANYVAPSGLSSVVAHLFATAGLEPTRAKRAVGMRLASSAGRTARLWQVRSADGHTQSFDGVILTQPLPEMVALLDESDARTWLTDETVDSDARATRPPERLTRSAVNAVQYSSRYALTLFFPPTAASTFADEIDWVARYINKAEDDAIVYLGYDAAKRSGSSAHVAAAAATEKTTSPSPSVSLIVHSSVPYALQRLAANTPDHEVVADLRSRVDKLLPWLPNPSASMLKVWRISQVRHPLPLPSAPEGKQATTACWPLTPPVGAEDGTPPPLVLAGDAFSPLGSRFDGCIQSGEDAAHAMARAILD